MGKVDTSLIAKDFPKVFLRENMADVGIIGMGVAGMTAALSAAEHGLKVEIFDRMADVASPIGGGFVLNGALLCLTKLGYRKMYEKHMVMFNSSHQIGADGKDKSVAFGEHLAKSKLNGHFGVFRRVDIMKSMFEALEAHPNVTCHLSHKAVDIAQDETSVTVAFDNGKKATFKSLLTADGIHSLGQKHVYADEKALPKPEHSGYCIYYGLCSDSGAMKPGDSYEFTFDGLLVLIMPLIGGETLFVMAHPRNTQDDPNAWNYPCAVDDVIETMKKTKHVHQDKAINGRVHSQDLSHCSSGHLSKPDIAKVAQGSRVYDWRCCARNIASAWPRRKPGNARWVPCRRVPGQV